MSEGSGSRPFSWAGSAALVLLVLAIYWQVGHFGFTNFDDPLYVTDNPRVLDGLSWAGGQWAFTTGATGNWHPLTWLSHMLDVTLFGPTAGGPHLVNAALHAANAVLLFRLLENLTGARWRSLAVACLFAAHPLHVESVAWIAERKDVLSVCLGLLALLAYVRHAKEPGWRWLLASLAAFFLSLMAKATLVTLPVLLLLLDRWPLGRRRYLEKLPFFGVAAVVAAVTFWVQRANGNMASLQTHPLSLRVVNAAWSTVAYLRMAVWPSGLAAFHPFPTGAGLYWKGGLALLGLAALTAGALRAGKDRPYLWLGWAWYLVTLLPVIGLVQVGNQGLADRYTYVPLVGPFLALVWWAGDLARPLRVTACFVAALAGLAALARVQVATWRDSVTLFDHAVRSGNDCALARKNLGMGHYQAGQYEAAEREYRVALLLAPRDVLAYAGLGKVLWAEGRREEALEAYREAARGPGDPDALYRLGRALAVEGHPEEALAKLVAFLQSGPRDRAMVRDARMLAGLILKSQGRPGDACRCFKAMLVENPEDPLAKVNYNLALGLFLLQNGRLPEAQEAFRQVLAQAPGSLEAAKGLRAAGG